MTLESEEIHKCNNHYYKSFYEDGDTIVLECNFRDSELKIKNL